METKNEELKRHVYLLLQDVKDDGTRIARAFGLVDEDEAKKLATEQANLSPYERLSPLVFEEDEEEQYEGELQTLHDTGADVVYYIQDKITLNT